MKNEGIYMGNNMDKSLSKEDNSKKKKPLIFNFSGKKKNKMHEEIPSESRRTNEGNVGEVSNLNNGEISNLEPVMYNDLTESNRQVPEEVKREDIPNLVHDEEKNKEVTPIFDPSVVEAAIEEKKESKDNFVPPADFSSIFQVESEEKTNVPLSVKLDSDKGSRNDEPVTTHENKNASKDDLPKEKITFNSDERLLYEIKPEKEGNPIVVILFFCLLFGAIVILPFISKKIDFGGGGKDIPSAAAPKEEEGDAYYFNRSSVRVKMDGLEFTNFVKSRSNGEYFLTFNITNTMDRAYQFDRKYYVVFLDGEAVLYRALIHTYEAIGSNAAQEITLTINERGYTSADRFRIEEIPVSAYPSVIVNEKDGDYSVLTCNYRNDEIKYYFQDNKLVKLKETITETVDNSRSYENNKAAYRNLSNSYKKVDNFTSTFVEANTYFTMINEFNHRDIADVTLANLKTYKFFRYNEVINTVSFELEAQGYTCG